MTVAIRQPGMFIAEGDKRFKFEQIWQRPEADDGNEKNVHDSIRN